MSLLNIQDQETGTWRKILCLRGKDGHTPVKGTDYYTEEEKAELEAFITQELTKRGQLKPEFVSSIEECVDTSKIYVLPDGQLYAYLQYTTSACTNLVPTSEALDSTSVYNEVGYKENTYISSTTGGDSTKTGHVTTGLIPWIFAGGSCPDPIYIKGGKPSRLGIYFEDKTFKMTLDPGVIATTMDEIGNNYCKISPVVLDSGNAHIYEYYGKIAYFRLDAECSSGENLIVTVGEDIEGSGATAYQWADTGHAFVPANYENRIVKLESLVEGLQPDNVDGVPPYIQQEAERVADLVQSKRTAQSIVFAAMSDIHYPYDDISDGDANTAQSLRHAGIGISQIRRYAPVDFVGLFGDYVAGGRNSTIAESKDALKFVHNAMYEAGLGVQQIWMQGNHDRNPYDTDDGDLTDDELYSYIFAHNTGTVVDNDNPQRGYGYKDFEAQKLRVVYWNSSDVSGVVNVTDHCFSADQFRWMANTAFDFSDKPAPTDWAVLMLSHMPMNWSASLTSFVDAYISGSSATVTAADDETVSVDFTDKPRAEFICAINGHTHNFRYSRVGANQFWQIAVPQICAGRYNEYGTTWPEGGGELDASGEPVYYRKKVDSAESTSFCVFVVDRKNRKIHALHYGAGIDREIDY